MEKVKVIFCITSLSVGGAERVFANLISNFDNDKFELILAVGVQEGCFLELIPKYVSVVELGGTKKASDSLFPLLKLIWKEKPDVVISTLGMVSTSALCSFFSPKETKFISRLGNTISADLNRVKRDSLIKFHLQKIYYKVVLKYTRVLAQSEYMKNDLVAYFNIKNDDIKVIHNPALKDNTVRSEDSLLIKSKLITVGRLSWQKGYDDLLNAMKLVVKKIPELHLTFIGGTGDEELSIKQLCTSLELDSHVRFLGHLDNPFNHIKNDSIFISSSRFEGFSNVIVEALSSGMPVIATDCPSGNREIIQHGENGWLVDVDVNVVENLANRIIYAVENCNELDMESEMIKIKNKFDLKLIVSEYESLVLGVHGE